jgi:hypothetical protein
VGASFEVAFFPRTTDFLVRRVPRVTQPVGLGEANGRAFGPEEGNRDAWRPRDPARSGLGKRPGLWP